jgi:hypothetical protein
VVAEQIFELCVTNIVELLDNNRHLRVLSFHAYAFKSVVLGCGAVRLGAGVCVAMSLSKVEVSNKKFFFKYVNP